MCLSIRPMLPAERNYSYKQSQQIMMKTGCIGHLRANFGYSGQEFISGWEDHCPDLKTNDFGEELNQVIDALREDSAYDGILDSLGKMGAYCNKYPESSVDSSEYGFRVDTDRYAYMLRLNPNPGVYNLYAYCYVKAHLDSHLEKAAKGIRFITPDYKELFRIPDGDQIRITTSDDTSDDHVLDRTCRVIDDTHFEMVYTRYLHVFHICQFAELMQHMGNTVIPLRSSLPDKCFGTDPETGETVVITKGVTGWSPTRQHPTGGVTGQEGADLLNDQCGVTKAQAAAMLAGATQGWASPSADPAYYDAQGNPLASS